jgi:hypothetical protein
MRKLVAPGRNRPDRKTVGILNTISLFVISPYFVKIVK